MITKTETGYMFEGGLHAGYLYVSRKNWKVTSWLCGRYSTLAL